MELPCLAFNRRDHSTALYTVSEENLIVALNAGDTDEILRNKTICPTARGWLLARDADTMATFLWSPQGGEQIPLPPLQGPSDVTLVHSLCLLSDEPSAPGCVVLVMENGYEFMWCCRPGDDAWAKHEYDVGSITLPYEYEGSRYYKMHICDIAACQGKFYFHAGGGDELGVLEFCPGPVFSSMKIDDSYESGEDEDQYENDEEEYEGGSNPAGRAVFLVESGGELYKVTLQYAWPYSRGIEYGFVEKMDFSKRRWRDVGDLGGRTFLLSAFHFGASCCCGGDSGLQKDCVYFVNSREMQMKMQVFNIKEDSNELHKLDEDPKSKAFWLLPSSSP